ncbi:vWA domain-containing protein [Demequina oxidasica]|uniref:vWA domain-containing protein n=1 Tax=Demequina oxidasica TaxID=676199 RepID=UPI0007853911|nr:vWA domain-containing protein [Demequina oxidasica]
MTDPNYTALLLIVDRSGSMSSIRDDMVGGLQKLVDDQAASPGKLTVDIVTFDDRIEHTHKFENATEVTVTLEPRGMTALWDAIGVSVSKFGAALGDMTEQERPATVQIVIVTDGMENASHEYTGNAINQMISHQRDTYSWDFVFLGANQDAVATARELGIDGDAAMTYSADAESVDAMHVATSRYIHSVRVGDREGFTAGERAASMHSDAQA